MRSAIGRISGIDREISRYSLLISLTGISVDDRIRLQQELNRLERERGFLISCSPSPYDLSAIRRL